jgi:NADPH:quinone reductase-like Zn-dependent oxidoreductase
MGGTPEGSENRPRGSCSRPVSGEETQDENGLKPAAEVPTLVDRGELRPAIDRVYELDDARASFERSMTGGKRGKVVIDVGGE